MELNAAFYDTLSRFRLSMGHKTSMNLTGNRKSVQKGSSTEFSDFREYMPGDDIRRIDWNAYGRLDRLYVKEYMEEKEAVVTILVDTSTSMEYGTKKKSELACMLTAALAYLSLNNMDRVLVYDMQRMQSPLALSGGRKAFPRLSHWLDQCRFEGTVDVEEAIKRLPAKGPGVTFLISDFLQDAFLESEDDPRQKRYAGAKEQTGQGGTEVQMGQGGAEVQTGQGGAEVQMGQGGAGKQKGHAGVKGQKSHAAERILRFLHYRKQKVVFLHVLAEEELAVSMTGTRNLIDMEDKTNTMRLTLDAASIRLYEKALRQFCGNLRRICAKAGANYAVCNTGTDFNKLMFQELRMLYDI